MVRRAVPDRDFVTVNSIASYCMVSRSTVRRWIGRGLLRGTRLPSGHVRVTAADFKEFLVRYGMPVPQRSESPRGEGTLRD